jgi:hypothetical protein
MGCRSAANARAPRIQGTARPRRFEEYSNLLCDPKFIRTNWRALFLADWGLDATYPGKKKLAKFLCDYQLRLSSPYNFFYVGACISATSARVLTRFGYADEVRARRLYDWLLEDPREYGG